MMYKALPYPECAARLPVLRLFVSTYPLWFYPWPARQRFGNTNQSRLKHITSPHVSRHMLYLRPKPYLVFPPKNYGLPNSAIQDNHALNQSSRKTYLSVLLQAPQCSSAGLLGSRNIKSVYGPVNNSRSSDCRKFSYYPRRPY